MRNRKTLAVIIFLMALAVVVIVVPFVIGLYYVDVLTMLLINIILVTSFRLITTTGCWSLAHVPLMGAGAYATALLTGTLGWSFWISMPLSAIAAMLIGLVMSYPLARTKAFAFFIASFAAGEAMRLCWIRFRVPFGGHSGLAVPPPSSGSDLAALDFSGVFPYYFLTLAITVISLIIIYQVGRSRMGDTFHALHMQERLAKSIGINVTKYRILAFVIGAFFAGVAGVLLAHRLWAIEPRQFGFVPTLYLLVWAVFGGTRTFAGPILGVVVLTALGEVLVPLAEWVPLIYGCILILTLLFLPEGLEGLPGRISPLIGRVRTLGRQT